MLSGCAHLARVAAVLSMRLGQAIAYQCVLGIACAETAGGSMLPGYAINACLGIAGAVPAAVVPYGFAVGRWVLLAADRALQSRSMPRSVGEVAKECGGMRRRRW